MSTQSLNDFRAQLNADTTLQKLLADALAQGADGIVKIGAEHGYSFTAEEVAAAAESTELTDVELEMVSGGGPQSCSSHAQSNL